MLPEAFLERMRGMLGEEYPAFCESFEREACRALRLNPLKRGADGRGAAEVFGAGRGLGEAGEKAVAAEDGEAVTEGCPASGFARLTAVPWAENGYCYEPGDQPGRHPFHAAGMYYIQEPSAMLPAELLQAQPGERVLDLCAAPGGKSTQIAAKMAGRGLLVCNDIHPARAKILSENIERMGIVNACVTSESPARLAELLPGYFHRALVDAPCSGEGMFRKNDAACQEWSPENVKLCAGRQDEILDCAARMLCPGGRLVYSTCTFAPEENEGSVGRFLQRHPEFRLLPVEKNALGLKDCDGTPDYAEEPVAGMENTFRLWPHKVKGEGHFAAVLEKEGSLPEKGWGAVAGGLKSLPEKELEEFRSFCRQNLREPQTSPEECLHSGAGRPAGAAPEESGPEMADLASVPADSVSEMLMAAARRGSGSPRYIKFGSFLYLVPAAMPDLRGLKILRPGLCLGELKKNRFEPSHALALALAPEEAAHVWNLSAEGPETASYLNGQTFSAEGEPGWYLICVEGFGIGWGKLAGGVMKNHYPRGLRTPL